MARVPWRGIARLVALVAVLNIAAWLLVNVAGLPWSIIGVIIPYTIYGAKFYLMFGIELVEAGTIPGYIWGSIVILIYAALWYYLLARWLSGEREYAEAMRQPIRPREYR